MRILVADDHELFLKGLEFILSDVSKDLQLVFAKSYTDIFKILETDRGFNLVLTDLAMPGANWEEAITRIHSTLPETPIIILSAVNLVMSGGVYIPPELLNRKLPDEFNEFRQAVELPEGKAVEENIKSLTPRQIDVLRCISQGMSNKQIAYALGLTEGTVKLHVTAILKILNVYNRTGAVVEASRLGLIKKND